MHGFSTAPKTKLTRRRRQHRQFKGGKSQAVLRAITAARLYCGKREEIEASSIASAACCGAGYIYAQAATTLVMYGDRRLIRQALSGDIGLLEAAALARTRMRAPVAEPQKQTPVDRDDDWSRDDDRLSAADIAEAELTADLDMEPYDRDQLDMFEQAF
jgi:hypothetical protein